MRFNHHRHSFFSTCLLLGAVTVLSSAVSTTHAAAGEDTLTLGDFVEALIENNPKLQAANAGEVAAEARIALATALEDPKINAALTPRTLGDDNRGQVSISQPLPWPGKRALRGEAAEWRARATGEAREALALDLIEQANVAYARWFHVHRALVLNREQKELLDEIREAAESRYRTGRGERREVIRAEVARSRLASRALALERELAATAARMNVLLGRSADVRVPPPAGLPSLSAPPPLPELLKLARDTHPELRALAHQGAEAKSRLALARHDYYPDLHLTTGYNQLWPRTEVRWTVGIGFNLPLDLGGKRGAGVAAARGEALQAEYRHADLAARLSAEIEAGRSRVIETMHQIALIEQEQLPLTEDALEAALAAWRPGGGSFTELLDILRERLELEEELLQYRAEQFIAQARLERWIGRSLADHPATTMEDMQ